MALTGEMGYPSALTAKTWGFYDVLFKGKLFKFQRPYGSYVIEDACLDRERLAAMPVNEFFDLMRV